FSLGTVGLDWQVAGFGPMNGAGTSDMVLRNVNTGAFEVYDIANNQLMAAASLIFVASVTYSNGIADSTRSSSRDRRRVLSPARITIQKAFTGSPKLTYPCACSLITSCRTL